MNYISLFSGIEAASVAWEPLGWHPVAFSEIEPFCCELLEKRFPRVPNLGDVSRVDWSGYEGTVDLVIGGSPCQAFSVAGRRNGLMDERGQLMLEYVRCVREVRPRWVIWENVPGVLSQDGGRAFGTLLRELEDCGYSLCWRVLDAQFFGVAQRRRRVFLVGHPSVGCAAGVLAEPGCVQGDNQTSRGKREELAARARRCAPGGGDGGCLTPWDVQSKRVYSPDGCAPTLNSGTGEGVNIQPSVLVDAPPFNTTQVTSRQNGSNPQWGDPCHTLASGDHQPAVCMGFKYEQGAKAHGVGAESEQAPTMTTEKPPAVCYSIVENAIGREAANGPNGKDWHEEVSPTLNTFGTHAVAFTWNSGMMCNTSVGEEIAPTLRAAHSGEPAVVCTQYGDEIAGTLTARHDSSPCADRGQNVVCMADDTAHAAVDDDMCGTLKCGGSAPLVASRYVVRRLMPVECERLQGFPDGWTDLGGTADAPRYRALGNSMAVPVIRWLGKRIEAVDAL